MRPANGSAIVFQTNAIGLADSPVSYEVPFPFSLSTAFIWRSAGDGKYERVAVKEWLDTDIDER